MTWKSKLLWFSIGLLSALTIVYLYFELFGGRITGSHSSQAIQREYIAGFALPNNELVIYTYEPETTEYGCFYNPDYKYVPNAHTLTYLKKDNTWANQTIDESFSLFQSTALLASEDYKTVILNDRDNDNWIEWNIESDSVIEHKDEPLYNESNFNKFYSYEIEK